MPTVFAANLPEKIPESGCCTPGVACKIEGRGSS